MMQILRRASLLVAFYLLTSAATAYAECAWVLWATVYDEKRQDVIKKITMAYAHSTKSACEKDRGERDVEARRDPPISVLYQCWPDTLDPRGPRNR